MTVKCHLVNLLLYIHFTGRDPLTVIHSCSCIPCHDLVEDIEPLKAWLSIYPGPICKQFCNTIACTDEMDASSSHVAADTYLLKNN